MKKAFMLLIVLAGILGLYAQAESFLNLRGDQITPEVIERVRQSNELVRGPSFNFTATPYNLPDAVDIGDPLTGRFKEDLPWTKDFTRHVNNPDGATLYMYYSNPEHFIITQPDPANPLKLQFQPIPAHWYGSELMVITVSDAPLGRDGRATATAIVRINVESVPDPPIFSGLPPANTFFVDEDDSLYVNFRDYVQCIDSSIFGFDLFVAQTQLSLPYNVNVTQFNPGDPVTPVPNGQLVKFQPIPDWPPIGVDGTVRFIVTAVDRTSNAFTAVEIYVTVIPENDPPAITGYLPSTLEFTIDQNTNQAFSVTVDDPDLDPLTHSWVLEGLLNGVPFSNVVSTTTSLNYLFDVPGTYTLTYTVEDAWEEDSVQWTIHVRPTGPLFNPVGGVFDHSITVTLTPPPGFETAVIYYTLDGSIPVPGAPGTFVYDRPIPVTTLENLENIVTIRAMYIHPDYPQSQVVGYTYRITGQVATLIFNPVGGTYYSQVSVTITCPNAGATIYYTTDGSDPIPGDSDTYEYTGPIVITTGNSVIIKAKAVRADWIDSPTRVEAYNVTGVVTIVSHTMTPPTLPDGEFYTVELGDTMPVEILGLSIVPPSATLYYTLDSSIPGPDNPNSIIYSPGDAIHLTCPTWITIRAYNPDWLPSTIYTYFYDVRTRTKIVSFPNGTVFDPVPGTYTAPVMVSINSETIPANAPVYYTTNGVDPTDDPALLYTGPFLVSAATTVKAIARDPSICPSQVYTGHYVITGQLEMPQFSPPPSSYENPVPITIYHERPGVTIYYTLDGTDPDESANLYSAPLNLPSGTHIIRARAYLTDWIPSNVRTGTFRFGYLPVPLFNLEGGVYTSPIVVQLSHPVDGASILYTTTGGLPATLYTGGIPVGATQPETVTISTKAVKAGWADSDVVTRTFQVTGTVVMPTFTPPGSDGPFNGSISVTIATSTPGATIKYTLDGQDPTDTYGIPYGGPVTISQSATLKARAFLAGWASSGVRSDDYTILGNIATPVFTPGTGTYTGPVNVFISVNPPDAQIYYARNGNIPTVATGILYVPGTPILVSDSDVLQAIAVKPGWNDSAIGSAVYTITGTVTAPTIEPVSGTYYTPQTITISSSNPGATIVYTTDGSDPSRTHGNTYGGPFNLGAGAWTVKAMAYLDTWNDSPINMASYVIIINPPISNPVFSPPGGYYTEPVNVVISAVPTDATIYYTTNGTDPSAVNGTEYTGAIPVDTYTVIKAIAIRTNWPDSGISTAEYFFRVANPVLSVPSGSYASPQTVSMSVSTAGAQIRYTTDGTDPSAVNGTQYDGTPIVISNTNQSTTVKAIAYLGGWVNSNIVSYTYVINPPVADPFFSVASGDYYAVFTVTMSTLPANASIYYTMDNTDPSQTNGTLYLGPVAINQNTTLKARAYMVNYQPSGIKTAVYNLHASPVSFNPPGGTYNANQSVTLNSVTPGATIWYTTDTSDPIPGVSAVYDPLNPILVDHNMTIKAIAGLLNWFPSTITSATYIIDIPLPDVANVIILPPSGVYTEPVTVSMSTSTPGAVIRYTTNGTEPTLANGNTYSAPFTVGVNTTVAARAFLAGWDPSPIATAQYIIVIPIQTVATPTFAPPAGVYGSAINVTISTSTPGASIRFTTDDTEPSETIGTLYDAPVNIGTTTTIKAIAYKTGMNTSLISNSSYVINIVIPNVEAPVFSIPSGTYYTPQTLAITTSTPGAEIRYTTDGSDPSPLSGTVYGGPITIPGNSTLFIKAIAYLAGWNPSPVVSANYIVTGTVADIQYSIPSGTYQTAQSLVLSTATDGASIYYTTDGSEPTLASQYYYQAIPLPGNTVLTVKARGFKTNWLPGNIGSETYNVTGTTAFNPPVLNPAPGTYSNAITISIGTPIPPTAQVYYTIDGSVPSAGNGTPYSGPFGINSALTVRAVALLDGWAPSYASGLYEFQAAVPLFTPPAGSYPNAQSVVLTCPTIGASIRYTTDGTDPSPTNGTIYAGPITVSINQTIKAYAFLAGYQDSPIVSSTYAIGTYIPVVATPVMDPVSGTYPSVQNVSISTSTPGAMIYYTTNGTEPTEASNPYTDPIPVQLNTTVTIKAKAFKTEWMPSATATEVYNVTGTVADVVFTPPAGQYTAAQSIVLTSATPGAFFRFTLDGSEPEETSQLYVTPIPAPQNTITTIKAKAYRAGWNPSSTGTAVYNITGTVILASPVFTPPAGTYSTPQSVTIATPIPSDALVRYTTDGSIPSPTNGTLYSGPVSITETTTLQAIAYKTGWTNSSVASAQYDFGVSSPVFSPQSGTYPNALDVTISSTTSGASIRYTTDGTDPTDTYGTLYSDPIPIPENTLRFFKAIAYKTGWSPSVVTSATYNVTGMVADIQFNPVPGTYNSAQTVFLSTATEGASIYYTTDGSEPTQSSTAYTAGIVVPLNTTVTIRARGFKANWTPSNIAIGVYNITGTTAFDQPVLTPAPGSYSNAINVTIGAAIPADALIYYTTDGSTPSATNGTLYGPPIPVDQALTIRAVAIKDGWLPSYIMGSYSFAAAAPVFNPPAGSYASTQYVVLTSGTTGAQIRYTTDGTDPSPTNGSIYSSPITVNINQTIKAYAFKAGYLDSPIITATYAIGTYVPVVATPVFDPLPGTYAVAQNVTISTSTPGATIRFTTDGSNPTPSSAPYLSPIPIPLNSTVLIKAIAYRDEWLPSQMAVGSYIITGTVSDVIFTPAGGNYTSAQSVVLTSLTEGAYFRYTTNGSDPTDTSTLYTTAIPVPLNATTTIKARAYKTNWLPSAIGMEVYNVTGQVSLTTPVFTPPSGNYSADQMVTIATPIPSDALVRYTTDGSIPSPTNGTLYSGPVSITETTTLQAIAYKTGWTNSSVASAQYDFGVSSPVFSPQSGTYPNALDVTISSTTSGASIRYTTDGTDPTDTYGTLYSDPIPIPENTLRFFKAIAYKTGWSPSVVTSATYNVTGMVADIQFNPVPGTYNSAQTVFLSTATEGASIYYTTDGSEPTQSSTAYTAGIVVPLNTTVTIRARGFKANWTPSNIAIGVYNITGTTAFDQPVLTPAPGSYSNAINVTIGAAIPADALIYYTTDGSTPSATNGTLYGPPIPVDQALTIRAVAIKDGWLPSYIMGSYSFAAAAPVFNPPAGSYASTQYVVLTSGTTGAQIRYTTDGTDPSPTNGSIYSSPITVNINQTIKAYAFKAGYLDSPIITATYAIGTYVPVVATPVFDPLPGTYAVAQNVTISTSTPGATIRFTTDGSNPTPSSAPYLSPIPIPLNSTVLIKAIAYRDEWLPSQMAVGSYIITGTVSDVIFTPAGGNYTSAQSVVLTSLTEGAYFRYTTNGSDPTDTSTLYTTAIPVPLNATTTIKARAYKTNWLPSAIGMEVYNVTGQVSLTTPVFTPPSGNYSADQMVTIATPIPSDALVRYTTDGSIPSPTNGTLYSGPVSITETTTLQAIAYKTGWTDSSVASAQYDFGVAVPTFDPTPGSYQASINVSITTPTPGASIRYTTDGTDPTDLNGISYTGPIPVPEDTSMLIKAIAYKAGWQSSPVSIGSYNVFGAVQNVSFIPAGGTYQNPVSVILTTNTPGATIRYTIDGSEPNATSPIYMTAIMVPLNTIRTIKAKAYRNGWIPSSTAQQTYIVTGQVVIADPVFSVPSGTYSTPFTVNINNPFPSDATIHYTTDGSDPTDTSPVYSSPIAVPLNTGMTIKAIAYRENWTPSPIYTATYTTTGQVALPAILFDPPAGTYQTALNVILNPAILPTDATLRYTLDGSEPSLDSPAYLNPIHLPLDSITTIKVKGFKADWIPSATASATYNITGQVVFNTPVFDPAPGVYTEAQMITVNTALPAGAAVYYTTDGSEPTTASQVYTTAIPLPLDTTLTLKVKAYLADWIPSVTYTGLYTTTGAVSIQLPVFTPDPGLYNTPQMVTLNTTTIPAGATLHYTLDGSDPSDQSPVYSEPITVSSGQTITIRVRAYLANWLPSIIHTGVYTVTGQVSITAPVFTPAAGTYQTPQAVTLSTITIPAGSTVRYTLDGSEPTETSTEYTGGTINLGLNSNTTIKAKAFKANWVPSPTYSASYLITGQVAINAPQFNPPAGIYQIAQSVTINTSTAPTGAVIRYTTNGTDPTSTSTIYTGTPIPVSLNTTMTIKARAYLTDWTPSDVYSATYTVTGQVVLPTPMFTPPAGNYTTLQQVTLNTATTPTGATLRYTLDGSVPTLDSPAYSSGNPIPVPGNATTTITVRGFLDNWTPSTTVSATYNVTGTVAFNTPWFSPEPGIYTDAIAVSIAPEGTIPAGATIRYTLNGTEPTATSPVYNPANPIQLALDSSITIKAKAYFTNWTESATITGNYTITGPLTIQSPQFNPPAGIYTDPVSVTINVPLPANANAVVRYTTNGSDPTPTSPIYSTPIAVNQSMQIKARAYATNWLPSEVYLASYTITGQVAIPTPVFNPPAGTYSTPQLLVINTPVPAGATIHYTLDGSEPNQSSAAYTQPIPLGLNQEITVKVKAYLTDWIPSITQSATYNMTGIVNLADPVFDPAPGVYTEAQDVEIITFTLPAGGTIRYTTDGSDPIADSPVYTTPIHIDLNSTTQIKVRGFVNGWDPSEIVTGNFRVTGQVQLAADPFNPAPGTYTTPQSVTLVNPVVLPGSGYTVHYTTDGTDPSPTNGSVYSGQALLMPLNSYTELKIKGFAQDWLPSPTMTAIYNITGTLPDPVFDPLGGLYSEQVDVSITCAIDGAVIRYTTDESEPTEASPILGTGETIPVPAFTQYLTITAKAFKPGWISNPGVAQTYTVLPLPLDVRAFTYGGYVRILWNLEDQTRVLQGFNVYRRTLSEVTFTKLNSSLVPPSQKIGNDWYYDDYAITTNVSYEYRVTAVYDGVESLPSGTTVVVYQSQELEISDASYAYPNPATTATKIKLVLTRNDNVSVAVSIYDFEGKKIKTLTVPATNSNLIEIPWDLKNSSNKKVGRGTYFARIVANDEVNKAERTLKISVK